MLDKKTLGIAELIHTSNNVTCSDIGLLDLSTAQECVGAVDYAKSFNNRAFYGQEVSDGDKPKGCYDLGYEMSFNTHSTGKRISSAKSICKKGNA